MQDFTDWAGGEMPYAPDDLVDVIFRSAYMRVPLTIPGETEDEDLRNPDIPDDYELLPVTAQCGAMAGNFNWRWIRYADGSLANHPFDILAHRRAA